MIDFLVLNLLQELKKSPVFKALSSVDKQRLEEIMEFVSQGKVEKNLPNEIKYDPSILNLISSDLKNEDDDLFDHLEEELSYAKGILQLKVTLKGTKPPIWRRIQVDSYMSFHELHLIIQAVMGWSNTHLYNFIYKDLSIELEDEGDIDLGGFDDVNKLDSDIVALGEFLSKEGDQLLYTYDFGDNWEHTVEVEKILPYPNLDSIDPFKPRCISAKRACPPEDCGGIYGYDHLLEVLSGPDSDEKQELTEWLGDDYDTEKVNLEEINEVLSNIFEDEDY
ncbi:plasmid pRiA4b ORF-3 family protein [Rummeliibacillus sp. JY-2-4R]